VLSLDIRLIVGMQAWRWAGLDFLSLYVHKVLPAVFALPAGLGDMAIGVTAPAHSGADAEPAGQHQIVSSAPAVGLVLCRRPYDLTTEAQLIRP
jgi:hypothetical protein